MVFDYMDHDLTGLMEREGHRFTVPQVGSGQLGFLACLPVSSFRVLEPYTTGISNTLCLSRSSLLSIAKDTADLAHTDVMHYECW